MGTTEQTYFNANGRKVPVKLEYEGDRIFCSFPFNRALLDEIKSFDGARYHGYDKENPRKIWSIKASNRNIFQLEFLEGKNPYMRYDMPYFDYATLRPLYKHQIFATKHLITRKQAILAGEMGVGKTLAAIEAMEWASRIDGAINWLWVGTHSSINAVKLEFRKWNCSITPEFVTYSSLEKFVKNNEYIPQGVVFDECSRVKTPVAKRSQAALYLAEIVRSKYGDRGHIYLMSGTPAPHNPCDWWHLCEIACPGYLKEGNIQKFRNRLAIIEERESLSGGVYPHLVTWKNSDDLCNKCGKNKDDINHKQFDPISNFPNGNYHDFIPCKNEVQYLGERLKGLVITQLKKDCLDIPDKIYRLIKCEPDASLLRVAEHIKNTSGRAITGLTLLRELSDGFQYKEEESNDKTKCPVCNGTQKCEDFPIVDPNTVPTEQIKPVLVECYKCAGTGLVPRIIRTTQTVKSPKDDVLRDLLDEFEDIGRVVIYAGFTASIDRCMDIARSLTWNCIRVDGRGWVNDMGIKEDDVLNEFQNGFENHPKIAFIAHPESGGMGLTLTASPVVIFFSNDFKAENRIQAEDRIHRPGMDAQRGATIIDIVNLKSDELILENLKKKRELQAMSMEELREYMK
ncbi:MAG TPA: DEAD/DEAH box helicase [Candidatus Cloacimonadota bacterium]|nr:DEAD/DEAH box helicase [Candidatus Cloacimonadota bacterium]